MTRKTINLKINGDIYSQLDDRAQKGKVSKTRIVEEALTEYFANHASDEDVEYSATSTSTSTYSNSFLDSLEYRVKANEDSIVHHGSDIDELRQEIENLKANYQRAMDMIESLTTQGSATSTSTYSTESEGSEPPQPVEDSATSTSTYSDSTAPLTKEKSPTGGEVGGLEGEFNGESKQTQYSDDGATTQNDSTASELEVIENGATSTSINSDSTPSESEGSAIADLPSSPSNNALSKGEGKGLSNVGSDGLSEGLSNVDSKGLSKGESSGSDGLSTGENNALSKGESSGSSGLSESAIADLPSSLSTNALAKAYGISETTFRGWVNNYLKDGTVPKGKLKGKDKTELWNKIQQDYRLLDNKKWEKRNK